MIDLCLVINDDLLRRLFLPNSLKVTLVTFFEVVDIASFAVADSVAIN